MIYDIWEMDLDNQEFIQVTCDEEEESMPYYDKTGEVIYCMRGIGDESYIAKIERVGGETVITPVYKEKGVQSYYPIVFEEKIYFTKWESADNATDIIIIIDEGSGEISYPAFNSRDYNVSDPYPISNTLVLVSSTIEGTKGGYDLYLGDVVTGKLQSLDMFEMEVNNTLHQLGVSYWSKSE